MRATHPALVVIAVALGAGACGEQFESGNRAGSGGTAGSAGSAGAGAGGVAGAVGGTSGSAGHVADGAAGAPSVPRPLAYYPFDGNTSELIDANGTYHGKLNGGTVVTGKVGNAHRLDGVEAYAEITGLPHTSSLSVSVWVWVASFPSKDVAVFDRWPWFENDRSFYLGLTDTLSQPRMMAQGSLDGQGAGNPKLVDPAGLPTDGWMHFAATWDQSELVFYRNGASVAALPANGPLHDAAGYPTLIGKSRHDPPSFLAATLDELALWDEALTSEQIALVHARGSAGEPLFQ